MNLDITPQDEAFRTRIRTWLEANVPKQPRPRDPMAGSAYDRDWQRTLWEGGFAGLSWPRAYGGMEASGVQQMIWHEEAARAKAPEPHSLGIALQHAGPTLIVRGTEEQKQHHLSRILRGDDVWCQGFSEPNAGSDLAAISTTGVIDGDHLVVNGQKMWTSYAHAARYQELLVRTEPGSKRHKGLTWIICEMETPGITVQPIINMMGEHYVNMIFYDDVRIPLTNVVGGMGNGWSVAMSTLSFERGAFFVPQQLGLLEKIDDLIKLAGSTRLEDGTLAIDDAYLARQLALARASAIAVRAMTISMTSKIEREGMPGAEGSLIKVYFTETAKAVSELALDILGMRGIEYGEGRVSNPWAYDFMWHWVPVIAGGSSQIQREIIADRVLELPRAR